MLLCLSQTHKQCFKQGGNASSTVNKTRAEVEVNNIWLQIFPVLHCAALATSMWNCIIIVALNLTVYS